ncbi:predicted protein [Botrytis cinerea T4]|uniref:Uncharacterized protein n=1 Tax=Botryotinia fuckeliana (strain T4) TaxID=999810 RepID=G2Y1Z5_BOTF4|nr:predicted protein [Botrytis cinerea T4]
MTVLRSTSALRSTKRSSPLCYLKAAICRELVCARRPFEAKQLQDRQVERLNGKSLMPLKVNLFALTPPKSI